MTNSKKLLLIATLSCGIPFNTFSSCNDPFFASSEHTTIAKYMPTLRNQTTISAETVVQWLDERLRKESLNKYDADAIAHILESNTPIDCKVANILQIIMHIKADEETEKAQQAKVNASRNRKKFAETAFVCGMFILFGAIVVIDAVVNPYPRCKACICSPFYLDGELCRYVHTCGRDCHNDTTFNACSQSHFYNPFSYCHKPPKPNVSINVIHSHTC